MSEKYVVCEKNQKKMIGVFFIILNGKYFYVFMYKNHPNGKKQNIINIKRYDSLCKITQIFIVFIVLIVKKIYVFL